MAGFTVTTDRHTCNTGRSTMRGTSTESFIGLTALRW